MLFHCNNVCTNTSHWVCYTYASDLTVGGVWYQRVHCLNVSHSQRGKVCCTNCTRQLSTLYWTHHMTYQLKWNNCVGCMRKRSLLSRCHTYIAGLVLYLRRVLTAVRHINCPHFSRICSLTEDFTWKVRERVLTGEYLPTATFRHYQ